MKTYRIAVSEISQDKRLKGKIGETARQFAFAHEMVATVAAEYPALDINRSTLEILKLMRRTYKIEVEPHFLEIKKQLAKQTEIQTPSTTKVGFGYEEVFTKSDIAMSAALVGFAVNDLGMKASYSEEHGPYSEGSNKIITYEDSLKHGAFWQFDPIDGSSRFEKGQSGFSMHAALLARCRDQNYRPLIGLVYDPVRDEAWFNNADGALYFDASGATQAISPFEPIRDKSMLRVHCSKSGYSPLVEDFCRNLARRSNFANYEIVDKGAGGAHFSAFLRGEVHVTLLPIDTSKQWDNANAVRLIQLRGGHLRDLNLNEFDNLHRSPPEHFNRHGDIAFREFSAEAIRECLPKGILQIKLALS